MANREPNKCCCKKAENTLNRWGKMIIYSRAIEWIEKLEQPPAALRSRYKIYRMCMILGLDIKCQEEYKPLKVIRTEINQLFQKYPKQVIGAITVIINGHYS